MDKETVVNATNPKSIPFPTLAVQCEGCAKCDVEGRVDFDKEEDIYYWNYGCKLTDDEEKTAMAGKCARFVSYTIAPKNGDRVLVVGVKAGSCRKTCIGQTGVVVEDDKLQFDGDGCYAGDKHVACGLDNLVVEPLSLKFKKGDSVRGWVKAVEVLPVPVSLNGCEKCSNCPAGAKQGDKCHPVGHEKDTRGIGQGNCMFFVQKACGNCGKSRPSGDSWECTTREGDKCYKSDHVWVFTAWIPRAPLPAPNNMAADGAEVYCAKAARKEGYEGNEAPPDHVQCPVYATCFNVKVAYEDRDKAEKALKGVEEARDTYRTEYQKTRDEIGRAHV